jgi:Rad3-related DNA helicase
MKESNAKNLLKILKMNHCDTLVGFAVMGGFFAEGIDLVGDAFQQQPLSAWGFP